METFFKDIDELSSLECAEKYAHEKLEKHISLFLKGTPNERSECAQAVRALKKRLHPVQTSAEAQELLRKHAATFSIEDRQQLQTQYVKLSHSLLESDRGVLFSKVSGLFDRQLAPLLAIDHGSGLSNRAKRAKPADTVFSVNAGLSIGDGGSQAASATDQHGNMIGSDWDLGRDGAYDGLKVVILHEYTGEGFTGDKPVRALRGKGFDVVHKLVRNKTEIPDVDELSAELENASQLWLISSTYEILEDKHLDLIVRYWQQGLGVYIFGDNEPYFKDANRLLLRMTPLLVKTYCNSIGCRANESQQNVSLQLIGNTPGGQFVWARQSADDIGPGFVPNHLLSTGLVGLFEGNTVASVPKSAALELGFEEVLREHSGQLVVVARESLYGYGPVIVDGAFTKLFCHWEEGGSSRFVRNCACWLSTLLKPVAADSGDKENTVNEQMKPPELNLYGSFEVECSITLEKGPAALLASHLADMEQNTTDFSLDNNLALARRNMVLGSQPLTVDVAKLFLEQGVNPFTREPVAAVVPLVDLSNSDNLKLVTEVANNLFMGGRAMNRHSLNILLSVCEEMLHRQPDSPEAIEFFIQQLLRNAVSTPDMLKGVPGGPTVPLEQGLRNNITATGEFVPLRKAFPHVARIVRLLGKHASKPRLPVETLVQVSRRSLLKTILGAAGRYAKLESNGADDTDNQGQLGIRLREELDRLLFDNQLGIPIGGTANLIELPAVEAVVNEVLGHHMSMDDIVQDVDRVAIALGIAHRNGLLSPGELTIVLLLMRERASTLWSILIEPLLVDLKKNSHFSKIWDSTKVVTPEIQAGAAKQALQLANGQLTGSYQMEPTDHARFPWPGFVTPFGPSVYRCKCGCLFGDPNEELTDAVADKLKEARNEHFRKMFSAGSSGYPTNTSVHFPLHRGVQRVLTTEQFRSRTKRDDGEMEVAVARYLKRKQRGNIHVSTIQGDIRFAIDTYLDCRKKGMEEPGRSECVQFLKKAKREQELILQSRTAGTGDWVDPPRPAVMG